MLKQRRRYAMSKKVAYSYQKLLGLTAKVKVKLPREGCPCGLK